jgi:hypothetical protein
MLDTFLRTERCDPPMIVVIDHVEMGRLITAWATGDQQRPQTVEELREQLAGIAVISDKVRDVQFCQGDTRTLVIRLPVRELIETAVSAMLDPQRDSRYPFPNFYSDFYRPGISPVMTPHDILMARIGDHAVSQSE